jgi:hypothetical protein
MRHQAGRTRAGAIAIGALVALAVAAPVAGASDWRTVQLTGEAAKVSMFAIDCPTTQLCVAVGGNNTIASSTAPHGGPWGLAYAGIGAQPTPSNGSFAGRQIRGVSCPGAGLCFAGTFEGDIYFTSNPTGPAAAWAVTPVDPPGPNTHIYGISCPTPSLCVAAAGGGRIVTSANPTGGTAAWVTTQLDPSLELRGVSCSSPTFCVVVGDEGAILSSALPTGGAGAWRLASPRVGNGNLFGVGCAAPLCVTGNTGGNLITSTDPLGPAPGWKSVSGGGSVQVTDASCVSASRCAVVDNNGDVLTSTDPTGGSGSWTFTNVLPYPGVDGTAANHFFGISCPTATLCAVAGNRGQLHTSTNAFTAEPVAPRKRKRPKKIRRGPKRPRVEIARGPRPHGLIARRGGLPAEFRFFAKKRAPVRGFVCSLDGRRMKRCRSPKRYRVGRPGWHKFKVRAIGRTGLRGPADTYIFRIYRRSEWPPV